MRFGPVTVGAILGVVAAFLLPGVSFPILLEVAYYCAPVLVGAAIGATIEVVWKNRRTRPAEHKDETDGQLSKHVK